MISIVVENDIDDNLIIANDIIEELCRSVLINEGHEIATVTFIFTDDDTLCKLKKEFFNLDVYTDVITFNLEDKGDPIEGEIYISWDRVKENAQELKNDVDEELKRMVIHSSLHLVGYEDESPDTKTQMTQLENRYLNLISQKLIQ